MNEKTFEEIQKQAEEYNKGKANKDKVYVSRTKLGFCKHEKCKRVRRNRSAFCGRSHNT